MRIIHFLGYKEGGKTRAISYVIQALADRGRKVGALKHIHAHGFDVDAKGKDTWTYVKSGARMAVAVSPEETVTISRSITADVNMSEILRAFRKDIDYVLVEGFNNEFPQKEVLRVVCARSKRDAMRLVHLHGKPRCVVGKLDDAPNMKSVGGAPVLRLPEDLARLLRLIGEA